MVREETFARQKALGVVPADCDLTERHEEIPAWDDMSDTLKPVLARQMEVYAGFLEYADHHVGRVIDALEELGILDDTVVYYIIGDNGASAEGSFRGTLNEMAMAEVPGLESDEYLAENIDKFGGPEAYNHYAIGWAHAMGTPYQWTKQVASHWGGTRNGTIVHWPAGIEAKGELRHQFCYVTDIAPTVLELAGLPGADHGQRHHPGTDARREHELLVRRRRRARAPQHPVLRGGVQPRHLPPGLVRGDPPPPAVGATRRGGAVRRGRVGALRRLDRLDPGPRPRRRAPRQARRAPAALPPRSLEVPGVPARRPDGAALQRRARRATPTRRGRLPACCSRGCAA